jgi:hypothetical protein
MYKLAASSVAWIIATHGWDGRKPVLKNILLTLKTYIIAT